MKKSQWKKVVTIFSVLVTMISCFYTVSLMNNDKIVKAMEQEREDLLMLTEAYKWIDQEDIDPKTGKLKEGVIYNIGEDGRAYTSEGFKNFEFLDVNSNVTPLTEYRTGNEVAYINYVQNRNEILFSNNFMVDFDITYDENNLNIEKKKYDLVKTEYTQSSHKEKRHRLVMKSKKVKVGWFKITVWYPAIEEYHETIIVTTPHNTYQEVVQHVGSISLEDDANVLTKLTAKAVDKYFPNVRTLSEEHNIPLLIMFMDAVVSKVVNVIRQLLSMIADFIPILDEIKTAFETVKGYDMFTGESIGTFWRIFGAITLAISLVVSFVSFGVGGVAIDAAADAAQFTKKATKLAGAAGNVNAAAKQLDNVYDGVKKMEGLSDLGGDALKYASKNVDEVTDALKKMDGDTYAELLEESFDTIRKTDNAKSTLKVVDNVDDIKVSKGGILGKSSELDNLGGVKIDSDVSSHFRQIDDDIGINSSTFDMKATDRGFDIDAKTGNTLDGSSKVENFTSSGSNSPIIDGIADIGENGTLVSTKSRDLRVKSYDYDQNGNKAISKLKSQINSDAKSLNSIADQYTGMKNVDLTKAPKVLYEGTHYSTKRLDVVIKCNGDTVGKYVPMLSEVARDWSSKGVEIFYYFVK